MFNLPLEAIATLFSGLSKTMVIVDGQSTSLQLPHCGAWATDGREREGRGGGSKWLNEWASEWMSEREGKREGGCETHK